VLKHDSGSNVFVGAAASSDASFSLPTSLIDTHTRLPSVGSFPRLNRGGRRDGYGTSLLPSSERLHRNPFRWRPLLIADPQ
jgi:hypothetical protein